MKLLIAALKHSQSKLLTFYSVFFFATAFLGSMAVLDSSNSNIALAFIPFVAAAILSAITVYIVCSNRGCQKKLLKILKEGGYSHAELESITQELDSSGELNFFDKGYRLSLFITRSWVILISTNGSVIEKKDNLISVKRKLMTSQSRYAIVLKFSQRQFVCPCDRVCEELTEIIKSEIKGVNQ